MPIFDGQTEGISVFSRNVRTVDMRSIGRKVEDRRGGYRTLEDTDGSGEVIDTTGSLESGGEDLNGRDEIVGEAVVQVTLRLKESILLVRADIGSSEKRPAIRPMAAGLIIKAGDASG